MKQKISICNSDIDKKICVIGLGYIGLPTGAVLAKSGYQVHGVDINLDTVAAPAAPEECLLNLLLAATETVPRRKCILLPKRRLDAKDVNWSETLLLVPQKDTYH